jgi:predicted GIY-YIG superfamily endonuclease
MALKYQDIHRFARENGKVKAFAKRGAVTLLKSGDIDTVAFFEEDAVRFEYRGKSYTRDAFERLVESKK